MWVATVSDISERGIGLVLGRSFEAGKSLVVVLPRSKHAAAHAVRAQVIRAVRQADDGWFLGCSLDQQLSQGELRAYSTDPRHCGILIVDDDPTVGKVLERGLRPQGFDVWVAGGGAEALNLYEQHRDAIGLVLMDVQMPELDGPHTLSRLQQRDPDIRCCFMSGELGQYNEQDLRKQGAVHVIKKPFRLLEVAQVIWQLV